MILDVSNLSHGFGDRAIFNNVSFRLLKGEHIGLVGANGEGKSTFFNIVTGKLMPDEGKIEWAKNVRVGYLDQHSVLSQGMSIRDVLKSAFSYLFEMEERMNEICDSLGTASPEEMDTLMEELGTIQDTLTMHDFYVIDAKVEEVARALGLLDIGLERDVTDLSGAQRTKVLLGKLLLEKPDILLLDEPTNYLDEEHIEWLKRYVPGLVSVVQNINKKQTNVVMGSKTRVLYGAESIKDSLGSLSFHISAQAFFQVNSEQAEKLYNKALEFAALSGKETEVDDYCGTGTISLYLARHAKQVYGIEIVAPAIENAKKNAEENKCANAEFICGDAAVELPKLLAGGVRPDVVVVAPPRAGCEQKVLAAIAEVQPERVVYVSCNPASLARD